MNIIKIEARITFKTLQKYFCCIGIVIAFPIYYLKLKILSSFDRMIEKSHY